MRTNRTTATGLVTDRPRRSQHGTLAAGAMAAGLMAAAVFAAHTAQASIVLPGAQGFGGQSNLNYASTNWSGYADAATGSSTFGSVSANWNEPTISNPSTGPNVFASFWVGLDGFNSGTVEQTGTQAEVYKGNTYYFAWYELYPAAEVPVFAINPGDSMSASVNYNASTADYTLSIKDITSGASYSTSSSVSPAAARSSAEWIAEAPSFETKSGAIQPLELANYGSIGFSNASASLLGSASASITGVTSGGNATSNSIEMVTTTNQLESLPSALSSNGSSFTVTYVPEPGSLGVLMLGGMAVLGLRRRTCVPPGRAALGCLR